MSLYDYKISESLAGGKYPFYALLMELIRQADDVNTEKIKAAWPEVYEEMQARYNAPGGELPSEKVAPANLDVIRRIRENYAGTELFTELFMGLHRAAFSMRDAETARAFCAELVQAGFRVYISPDNLLRVDVEYPEAKDINVTEEDRDQWIERC